MPDKKHIVILGPAYPLRGGGLSTFNERLARELQLQGHHVSIFTFSLQYPSFLFPGKSQYSTEPPPADLDIRVSINSVNPINWLRVGRHLKKLKPDILLVRYWIPFMAPCLATICRLAKKNRHTKVICIADNIIPHETRPGDTLLTRYFLPAPHAFITMSDQVSDDLKSFKTNKKFLQVAHPLYDNFGEPLAKSVARQKLGFRSEEKLLLFFGFIRKYKGLDLLLEAMGKAIIKERSIRLLIAGEFYQDKRPYLEQIEKLGLSNQVVIHDQFIPDRDVKLFCCAADFIVQPYKHATQSGVTPLAYHFNVPMIVTNVGGLPDMVIDEETGLVAEPDPDSIAQHLARAFDNGPDFYRPALQSFKKNFSWSVFTEKIFSLYHDI